MVIRSSVSWKACDKSFLNSHIWLLDCQCCGKYATKFSRMAINGHWAVSVMEAYDNVY